VSRLVDLGDCRIACTVSGSGPALLLMHGAEGDHRMFDALASHLATDFSVIAYDQRDCGGTKNPDRPSSLRELALDAVGLLDALGQARAHVYGSSFGGRLAQALAHHAPQRVETLVLGNTWALPESLAERNAEAVSGIQRLRGQLPESSEALAEYMFTREFLAANPQWKLIFRDVQPQTERTQRRQQAVGECPALFPADLRMPVLVITSDQDRVVPSALSLEMAHDIPGAQSIVLTGIAHASPIEAPALIARHLRDFCILSNRREVRP